MWTGKRCCKNGSVDAKLIVLIVCTLEEGAGVRAAMRVFAFLIRSTIIIITRRHRWVGIFCWFSFLHHGYFPAILPFCCFQKTVDKELLCGVVTAKCHISYYKYFV